MIAHNLAGRKLDLLCDESSLFAILSSKWRGRSRRWKGAVRDRAQKCRLAQTAAAASTGSSIWHKMDPSTTAGRSVMRVPPSFSLLVVNASSSPSGGANNPTELKASVITAFWETLGHPLLCLLCKQGSLGFSTWSRFLESGLLHKYRSAQWNLKKHLRQIPKHPNNFKSISIHCLRPNETLLYTTPKLSYNSPRRHTHLRKEKNKTLSNKTR